MLGRMGLAITLMAACFSVAARNPVTPVPTPIAPDLAVELISNQNELAVDVPDTAAQVGAQFGLIGAIIGTSMQNAQAKKAEARVAPLRDLLVEYHFDEKLAAALRTKLASEGISPAPVLTVLNSTQGAVAPRDPQSMPLQALVLTPRYAMDSGFAELSVKLTAQLVNREIKSNGRIKSRDRLSRSYAFRFPMQGQGDEEGRIRAWSGLGGAAMSHLLDVAIGHITDMLVHDFSTQGRSEWVIRGKQVVSLKGQQYQGYPVRVDPDWVWLRTNAGALEGRYPVSAGIVPPPVAKPQDALPAAAPVATSPAAISTDAGMPVPTTAATPTTAPAVSSEPVPAATAAPVDGG